MKKYILLLFLNFLSIFIISTNNAYAIENPLTNPNNKIGMHILFDHELIPASKLINSTGGDWGYVTIVIQAGDKDLVKWQKFMDSAKQNHVIPIVRLSTEGDYFNTKVWRKPNDNDILDFANFLDSLDWPVKNRYIIVFNEVNRAEEWGGELSPAEYAKLLNYAITLFKSKNPDYFIISAGLDNAAPNQANTYMNQYNFMRQMNISVPGIFSQIDGLSSHSYPNPAFSQHPSINSLTNINSFQYEQALAESLSNKKLPVFITETGWSTEAISDSIASNYYKIALNTVWDNPSIVAITPFLFQGQGGPFQKFSFVNSDNTYNQQYYAIKNYQKTKGKPSLTKKVLSAETRLDKPNSVTTLKSLDFSKHEISKDRIIYPKPVGEIFKWLLRL